MKVITESDQVLGKLDSLNLQPTLNTKAKEQTEEYSEHSNLQDNSESQEQHVFIINQETNEMNSQDSNLEVLSNLLNEFYGSSIEVKRIVNHDKTPSKDVSIVKKRLKDFQVKLQDTRKQK